MKKFPKIFAAVMIVCLLCGVVFAIASFGAYKPLQSLTAGTTNGGYFDFDSEKLTTNFNDAGSDSIDVPGTKGKIYQNSSSAAKEFDAFIKEQTLSGRKNKYLNIKAAAGVSISSVPEFVFSVAPYLNGTDYYTVPNYKDYYYVVDLDICATEYLYTYTLNGTKVSTMDYSSIPAEALDSVTKKLAYPEGMYIATDIYGKRTSGHAGPSAIKTYIVSNGENWYLSNDASYGSTDVQLSSVLGEWNHITMIYTHPAGTYTYGNANRRYLYLNGKYVATNTYEGYSSTSTTAIKQTKICVPAAVASVSESLYSFGVDNATFNFYENYVPTVENSFVDIIKPTFDSTKTLFDCEDLVYNKNYISPGGNNYTIKWNDLEGNQIFSEALELGKKPSTDKSAISLIELGDIIGDITNLSAWEWNVSADASVFTPVGELTQKEISEVTSRGDTYITLRPAVANVSWTDAEGAVLKNQRCLAGTEVQGCAIASNGWYALDCPLLKNATPGADEDSFVAASGDNVFVIDENNATPAASIEGIRYNMSLLTNYYMNIYVPADMPENVRFLGFYSDSALSNKYTSGVRKVSISDKVYSELSFGVANSDIDVTVPKYVGIEVVIGDKTYELSYEVDVNVLKYCKSVLDIYGCGTEEASLVVNLLRYANEAYKLASGTDNAAAAALLLEHADCGCLLSLDVTNEYKGKVDELVNYLYGAAYNVTAAQPSLMLYLLADKADDVSKITVSYKGFNGEIEAVVSALAQTTIDGQSVIPYSYAKISASDVKEVMTITVYGANDTVLSTGTYGLANYAYENEVAVANALFAFSKAAYAYKEKVVPPSQSEVISDLSVFKTDSLVDSMTVSPGGEITYTITVTNMGGVAVNVPIFDKIPANTTYKSGSAILSGSELYWNVSVAPGATETVSYTVVVDNDMSLINGGYIAPPDATVGGNVASCSGNYIELTFNSVDMEYIKIAILAHKYSEFTDTQLAKYIYQIAFTKNFTMSGNTSSVLNGIFGADTDESANHREMVIPTLFGGSAVSSEVDARFKGARARITADDLITGDFLLFEDSTGAYIYVYDGEKLINITEGYADCDTYTVITTANAAEKYAALRPSIILTSIKHSDPNPPELELTDAQKALIATAKTYVLRGYRLQYDDTRFDQASINNGEYRWQVGLRAPEDYTSDEWGYINCAGFTYDIYLNALGYDLGSNYTTVNLMYYYNKYDYKGDTANAYAGKSMHPYFYAPTHAETPAEIEKVKADINSTLEVGDLIVIRRYVRDTSKTDTGHVMMYIGNGKLVHSTGSNFSYGSSPAKETYEPTIRYMNVDDYFFNPAAANYLFDSDSPVDQFGIIRPLDKFKGTIPENTVNRMENMAGIVAEKLSSHKAGQTANRGEEVTFTFKIFNTNSYAVTLNVFDVVPSNSAYVSGADIFDGNKMFWTVQVAAGATAEVSYTVRVNDDATFGDAVYSADATVGGVSLKCPKVYINKTLAKDHHDALIEAIEYFRKNNADGLVGTALANAIYEYAGLTSPFAVSNTSELATAIFGQITVNSKTTYELLTDGAYYDIIAPTLYGGERLYTPNKYSSTNKSCTERTRLPAEHDLIIGDILYASYADNGQKHVLYMYAGEDIGFVSLGSTTLSSLSTSVRDTLVSVVGYYYYFAVLRPSMADDFVMEEKHAVSFDSDGGSAVATARITDGGTVSAPVAPTRVNHNFLGWYLNGEEYEFGTPVTGDITLVAKWESIKDDSEFFDGMQTVLLLGQSNMMGQGDVMIVDPITDDRIFMMRDDRWVKMQEPLHTNSYQAGIGLGASFAKAFVDTFDTQLGLIPAAKGATTLEMWAVGGDLYNEAVRRAKIAQQSSEICAILWHQGEGNVNDTDYAEKLQVILDSMIAELGLDADKIIIVTGELSGTKGNQVHTPELMTLGKNYKNYGIAQSDGLTLMSDKTHFDSPSLRLFGYRYFNVFYNVLAGRNYDFVDNRDYYYSEQTPIDENTWFPFDELVTGSAPAGACGSGNMGLYLQNGSASILEESATDKYLSVSNGVNSAGTGYTTTFVNSYESASGDMVIVTEGMFRLGEGSNCDAYLLMVVTEEGTNAGVYRSVVVGANGTIYTVSASGARVAVGTMGTEDWVHVKVVLDLKNNLKTVYIDGVAVMENATISNTVDTTLYDVESVSLMQFSVNVNNTIGTVHVDDYRFYPQTQPEQDKSISILSIGNSYSVDAMRYLYGILQQAGYEDIKLGTLYIGGCTLDTHYLNMKDNNEAYTLYLSSDTAKVMVAQSGTYSIEYALGLEDWDIVTIQQRSGDAGAPDTYGNLQNVIDYVKENEPGAEIDWHMTWSYGPGYWDANGDEKQIDWYNSIVSTVQSKILTNSDIAGVIPVGTAIQNLRTSSLGNDITRDDTHLSYGIGRYTAALTWAAYFTDCDLSKIDGSVAYKGDRESYEAEIKANIDIIKEAVENALSTPYSVTNSVYPSVSE